MNLDAPLIHVAYCFDKNYRQHLGASIASLLLNCSGDGARLHLHLVTDTNDEDFERRLDRFRNAFKARIDVVTVNAEHAAAVSRLPTVNHHIPYMAAATWLRVLLPVVLPHLDRVLYLDADTVVPGDISQLWDTDLGGAPVAGAPDAQEQAMRGRLRLRQYVNSGVLLIDLAQWRKHGLVEMVLQCAQREAERIRYADQCAINLALAGRIHRLEPRWNRFATHRNGKEDFSDAGVIHFITKSKPWQAWYENPAGRLYWRYLEISPWSGAQPDAPRTAEQMVRLARLRRSADPAEQVIGLYERAFGTLRARHTPTAGQQ